MTRTPENSSDAVERSNGFTAGPWNISADHPYVDSDGPVCKINLHNRSANANTRLIAAAPDLLAALEECLITMRAETPQADMAFSAARAAVAKALSQ